ncbi:hypothetical protein PoMZ_03258 [Pyricularia oryzae]|uniref:Uncharacterized protein n=1 Tax=Pyricularia oryzae TaxID=318829 RepID=A0A4P7NAC3_PYROR|nr:hypothetical protein PoMZ_03258 [Pyricularia oryzae]
MTRRSSSQMRSESGAAIQNHVAASGIARAGAAEEHDGVGHLLGQCNPAHRHRGTDRLLQLGHVLQRPAHHGGVDPRRADAVDTDAVSGVIESCREVRECSEAVPVGLCERHRDREREGWWPRQNLPALLVRPSTACLAVVYWTILGVAANAAADPKMTMQPRVVPLPGESRNTGTGSCVFMSADTARVTRKVPLTLTWNMASNSTGLASAISVEQVRICMSATGIAGEKAEKKTIFERDGARNQSAPYPRAVDAIVNSTQHTPCERYGQLDGTLVCNVDPRGFCTP